MQLSYFYLCSYVPRHSMNYHFNILKELDYVFIALSRRIYNIYIRQVLSTWRQVNRVLRLPAFLRLCRSSDSVWWSFLSWSSLDSNNIPENRIKISLISALSTIFNRNIKIQFSLWLRTLQNELSWSHVSRLRGGIGV